MYNLPYFKDQDSQAVMAFIHAHPFAFIAGCNAAMKPVATQIPVFLEEREGVLYLTGHMMKKTDHHLAFEENPHVLCVFSGAHSYVSATWYSDPHQASTWNYMSVHAKGEIRFLGDDELIDILRKTSLHFEGHNETSTTSFDNLPSSYTAPLMKAIVAFQIKVLEMDHVFKLSQNRDAASYRNIVHRLEEGDANSQAVAEEMKKREQLLYPDQGS